MAIKNFIEELEWRGMIHTIMPGAKEQLEKEMTTAYLGIKNHYIGWFGSYGWASRAVTAIGEWNETRGHFEKVGEPVEMRQALSEEVKAECWRLGHEMAAKLLADEA